MSIEEDTAKRRGSERMTVDQSNVGRYDPSEKMEMTVDILRADNDIGTAAVEIDAGKYDNPSPLLLASDEYIPPPGSKIIGVERAGVWVDVLRRVDSERNEFRCDVLRASIENDGKYTPQERAGTKTESGSLTTNTDRHVNRDRAAIEVIDGKLGTETEIGQMTIEIIRADLEATAFGYAPAKKAA